MPEAYPEHLPTDLEDRAYSEALASWQAAPAPICTEVRLDAEDSLINRLWFQTRLPAEDLYMIVKAAGIEAFSLPPAESLCKRLARSLPKTLGHWLLEAAITPSPFAPLWINYRPNH